MAVVHPRSYRNPLRPRAPTQNAALVVMGLLAAVSIGTAWRARHVEQPAAAPFSAPQSSATAMPAVTGFATFYAGDFNGGTMANGAAFDMNDATTAAANAWPLGTRLRLRRVPGSPWDNQLTPAEKQQYFGRSITVTVTDRGAFTHALDLSRAAFALLGRTGEGVIRVSIEVLPDAAAVPGAAQVASTQ